MRTAAFHTPPVDDAVAATSPGHETNHADLLHAAVMPSAFAVEGTRSRTLDWMQDPMFLYLAATAAQAKTDVNRLLHLVASTARPTLSTRANTATWVPMPDDRTLAASAHLLLKHEILVLRGGIAQRREDMTPSRVAQDLVPSLRSHAEATTSVLARPEHLLRHDSMSRLRRALHTVSWMVATTQAQSDRPPSMAAAGVDPVPRVEDLLESPVPMLQMEAAADGARVRRTAHRPSIHVKSSDAAAMDEGIGHGTPFHRVSHACYSGARRWTLPSLHDIDPPPMAFAAYTHQPSLRDDHDAVLLSSYVSRMQRRASDSSSHDVDHRAAIAMHQSDLDHFHLNDT